MTTAPPTVVLVHGLFGFRRFLWIEYFQGARQLLQSLGCRVLVASLPWSGSLQSRSHRLAEFLARETGPLHLIAHSMGGLDARHYITHLNGHKKVASLTTLATPHHGSAAADHVCASFSPFRAFAGIHDLTRESVRQFNATTPDHPQVIYRSFSAARPIKEQPWIVRRYGRIIQNAEGDNDSQVSIASACWGEHICTVHADHFELIGRNFWFQPWRKRQPFDHLPLYRETGMWILKHHG